MNTIFRPLYECQTGPKLQSLLFLLNLPSLLIPLLFYSTSLLFSAVLHKLTIMYNVGAIRHHKLCLAYCIYLWHKGSVAGNVHMPEFNGCTVFKLQVIILHLHKAMLYGGFFQTVLFLNSEVTIIFAGKGETNLRFHFVP